MSKLAYFFVTLLGAVPAGGALYLLIKNFLDRADRLGGVLLGVTVTISVCMVLVALTPFMVLVFYKDSRPAPGPRNKDGDEEGAVAAVADDGDEPEGFGDIIPDDYDPDELSAAVDDGGEDEDLDEAYDDYDDEDGEYDDFDYEDE